MAMNPLVAIGMAVGAYFLVANSKKESTTTFTGETKGSGSGTSGSGTSGSGSSGSGSNGSNGKNPYEDLPNPNETEDEPQEDNSSDNTEDLPNINEDDPKQKIPDDNNPQNPLIMKDYYWLWFPENLGEKPAVGDPSVLWISDTCQSWAIGKEFLEKNGTPLAFLPEKYVFEGSNSDKLISPAQWWKKIGGDLTPNPFYLNNRLADTPAEKWAENLINYHSKCKVNFPHRSDFKDYKSFNTVAYQFVQQSAIGKLWYRLFRELSGIMYDAWFDWYPIKGIQENLKYASLTAVVKYPKMSSGNQTDEAYKLAFFGANADPNAPKKIDKNNPNHKPYLDAWLFMNVEVKGYRELISKYGPPGSF